MRTGTPVLFAILSLLTLGAAGQSLRIDVLSQNGAIVGEPYSLPLQASGGTAPYSWSISAGTLPPGLKLNHSGRISGVPTSTGSYHFTVAVSDAGIPKLQQQREITIPIIEGLSVDWKEAPAAHGKSIGGSAVITNQSPEDFNLTVIVVAVNESGRATTLGYQHFVLHGGSTSQAIPFGSSPGIGTYYVRVDAVAHAPHQKHIYRASKQTPSSVKVSDF